MGGRSWHVPVAGIAANIQISGHKPRVSRSLSRVRIHAAGRIVPGTHHFLLGGGGPGEKKFSLVSSYVSVCPARDRADDVPMSSDC